MMRGLYLITLLLICASRATADLSDEQWVAPIGGEYAVRFDPRERSRHDINQPGKYQLIQQFDGSMTFVLTNLEQITITNGFAVGKANGKYFVFDLNQSDDAEPMLFDDESSWRAQLRSSEIDPQIQLNDPSSLSNQVTKQTLQPWKFKRMQAAGGWDDSTWSLVFQIVGLVIAIFMGLFIVQDYLLIGGNILLGFLVAMFAQSYIAGEGPGLCGAVIVLPIIYLLGAKFGNWIREITFPRRAKVGAGLLQRKI